MVVAVAASAVGLIGVAGVSPFRTQLLYARFKAPAQARAWQPRTGSAKQCSAETTNLMHLYSSADPLGCVEKHDGIDIWRRDQGSTVVGWYADDIHDQKQAVKGWARVAKAT